MGCRLLTGLILTAHFVLELTDGQVPIPTVTINSSTIAVRSTVTLTCTVMLNPVMDSVPVTVNTVWTGPAGFMTNTTAKPVMGSTTTYTSTATISSLGRDQSGVYTCTATVSSTSLLVASSMTSASASTRVTVGVYLSLKGVVFPNNSYILINEIDQTNRDISPQQNFNSNNGLQCITDRMPCCQYFSFRFGQWLFPNRSIVPPIRDATTFYRNRGDDGMVNLNRLSSDVMMPTGKFCCIVPDATSTNVTMCANIVLELPPTTSMPTQETIDQSVAFQLTSSPDSIDVSFSLICNSTGGPVTSLIWKRDGVLLDNTNPLVLTDPSIDSYTNVLNVSSRTTGAYTCLVRGPNDELLNSTVFIVQAASAPVNVKASQSSASAPVEVRWSPPSGGAATITGYRIFYHNQKNIFVSSYVTSIVFDFIEIKDALGKTVSIRSESTQLPSEPINVTVMNEIIRLYQPTPSYSTNVCVAVSLTTIIALAAVVLTTVIFFMGWLRKKRQSKKCEISISTNMSYGQLKLEVEGGKYEDPDKIRSAPGNYELMQHSADDECSGSKQAAAVYITSEDTGVDKQFK